MRQIDDAKWDHIELNTNGLRFHAVEEGEGPVVLMLHGFPENWYAWRHQIPALAEAGYRAVAVDLRGYNRSDRPRGVRAYLSDRLCEDVNGVIDALGAGRVHLVAHDWGGAVAWQFAGDYPQRLRSLSVLNAPHPKAMLRELTRNPSQMKKSWYILFFQIPWLPERLIAGQGKKLFGKAFAGAARRREMFPDHVIEAFYRPMTEPYALTAALNYYRAYARSGRFVSAARRFPKLDVPTLLVWAQDDVALGPELAEGLEGEFTGDFELVRVENCSHWVQQEQPEQVNDALLRFLKQHG